MTKELAYRQNDGIDVRLLWNSHTDRVSIAVEDERSGESFEFEIDSGDASAAFHHELSTQLVDQACEDLCPEGAAIRSLETSSRLALQRPVPNHIVRA